MSKDTVNKIEALAPNELDELKKKTQEYIRRREDLEGQIKGLREDMKSLDSEFEEEVDLKTLKQIIRILKIEAEIAHRDAADMFREALTDPAT